MKSSTRFCEYNSLTYSKVRWNPDNSAEYLHEGLYTFLYTSRGLVARNLLNVYWSENSFDVQKHETQFYVQYTAFIKFCRFKGN
jgi:hypothetical protein